jgi:hypothetical protein
VLQKGHFVKTPAEDLDYYFDWRADSSRGGPFLDDGEALDGTFDPVWEVEGEGEPGGLSAHDEGIVGDMSRVWLTGGTVGRIYTVSCLVRTSRGRKPQRSLFVHVHQTRPAE